MTHLRMRREMCVMTQDSLTCVTWLTHVCVVTQVEALDARSTAVFTADADY